MDAPTIWSRKKPSFGFVSTRLAGTDGVSLEARKWVEVLQARGCPCYFMAGELDTEPAASHLAPKAHFQHDDILEVQSTLFQDKRRTASVGRLVRGLAEEIRAELETFYRRFEFEILVVQNALAIPMNVPLGIALTEFIMEHRVATIAHHHDFYWERQRFQSDAALDYLRAYFPPAFPTIQNVVINSAAGAELGRRTGQSWTLVPNVLDFKVFPPAIDEYSRDFRTEIGVDQDTLLILQPTRIVSRKGIETAIEFVKRLEPTKATLVITHESGDEGELYRERIEEYARFLGVDLRLVADRIGDARCLDDRGRKMYRLWDTYPHCDLVSYPSVYEGYGNAFVEAVYFRKPILVNRYDVFEADIEPKGFEVIAFSDYVTRQTVEEVRQLVGDVERQKATAETNYMLGWRYLSYEMLEEKLEQLLVNHYGS